MVSSYTIPEAASERPAATSTGISEEEFELIYRRHSRALLGYLVKLSGNYSVAEDLLQRTFLQFLRAPLIDVPDERQRAYLYRIATNSLTDHWRKTKQERGDSVAEGCYPGDAARVDVSHDFGRVFGQLNPKERALLWFAHVEELPHREIADAVGVREGSVKVMLFRARRKLAGLLAHIGYTAGGAR